MATRRCGRSRRAHGHPGASEREATKQVARELVGGQFRTRAGAGDEASAVLIVVRRTNWPTATAAIGGVVARSEFVAPGLFENRFVVGARSPRRAQTWGSKADRPCGCELGVSRGHARAGFAHDDAVRPHSPARALTSVRRGPARRDRTSGGAGASSASRVGRRARARAQRAGACCRTFEASSRCCRLTPRWCRRRADQRSVDAGWAPQHNGVR